jgi:hypothetical protein
MMTWLLFSRPICQSYGDRRVSQVTVYDDIISLSPACGPWKLQWVQQDSTDPENLGIGGTHFGRPIRFNFLSGRLSTYHS